LNKDPSTVAVNIMALDPWTALGLASNIIQFIDFVWNLVSESKDIYRSTAGMLAENVELEVIANDLSQLSAQFQNPSGGRVRVPPDEEGLRNLALRCSVLAEELLGTIQRLKVEKGPHRKWKSFRQALLSMSKKDKILELRTRLDWLRNEMTIQIVAITKSVEDVPFVRMPFPPVRCSQNRG
jgi:hypothetical protein